MISNTFKFQLDRARVRTHVLNMFRNQLVAARRCARIWSGGVLLVGALALYLGAARLSPVVIIGASWLGATIAYGLARRHPPDLDPRALAATSVVVPALGLLALLPLTLHLIAFAALGEGRDFAWWVQTSIGFTAITTIVTGILIGSRGRRLANDRPVPGVLRPWGIYGLGVAAACLPGIVVVIPVVLVAVTGLAIVPFVHAMESVLRDERELLATAELPTAIAHLRTAA